MSTYWVCDRCNLMARMTGTMLPTNWCEVTTTVKYSPVLDRKIAVPRNNNSVKHYCPECGGEDE